MKYLSRFNWLNLKAHYNIYIPKRLNFGKLTSKSIVLAHQCALETDLLWIIIWMYKMALLYLI